MPDNSFQRGIALFNAGDYFEAHEVWEDVWRPCSGPERRFLQGLIQVAVALHHHSTGNLVGARSLLRRGTCNLAPYGDRYLDIDVAALLADLRSWSQANHPAAPPRPRIRRL